VYSSYLPTLFIGMAVSKIWIGLYAPMMVKTKIFVLPFAFWVAYVLGRIAITELRIARESSNPSEQRIMRTLAASFIAVGLVIFAAIALGVGEGTRLGVYFKTIANLGSLLPSALLAYYIYRYRYLELVIEGSLVVATFAAAVLTILSLFHSHVRRVGHATLRCQGRSDRGSLDSRIDTRGRDAAQMD
jgi:hypothetical protein